MNQDFIQINLLHIWERTEEEMDIPSHNKISSQFQTGKGEVKRRN